jgi:hypothetical protein
MKKTSFILGLLAPWCLLAQMQLFVVEQEAERAVGPSYFVGTAPSGDWADTTFRLRNSSTSSVRLHGLNVAGYRFSFASLPKLPMEVAVGAAVEFVVRFQPDVAGSYSAYLNINGVRYTILLGTASAGAVVALVEGASQAVLSTGDAIDFGSVEPSSRSLHRFALTNPTAQLLTIRVLTVDGKAFRGPIGVEAPLELQPEQSLTFDVAFEPQAEGVKQGNLEINQRRFTLRGTGRWPVFPEPEIIVDPPTLGGGQQAKISIRLASKSQDAGSGELSMEFTPSVPGKGDDPAVQFPASGSRSIAFTVEEGQDMARFGSRTEVEFQTGTTAGTLVFTVRLGSFSEELTVAIPPDRIVVDSTSSIRSATGLEVQVTGFDTSRSGSHLSFTFYNREGGVVAPGAIKANATDAFRKYFETTEFGGMFSLRAVFPVNGNVLQITAFEVGLTNSLGTTSTPRTAIQ